MTSKLFALVVASAATLALLAPPPTMAHADPPSSNTILFEDDFTGSANASPDSNKWTDWSSCTYDSTAAFGLIGCGDNETLDGAGHLRVPATPTVGSAIRTDFTFDYGVASAWIKLPAEEGYWPAFWSLNNAFTGGAATTTDPVGEVDIMETWTKFSAQTPGLTKALGHTWTGNSSSDYHSADNTCSTSGLTTAYHKYSAKYEPNKITYYVDDVECGTRYEPSSDPAKKWGLGPAVTDDNWLILDLAIGDAGGQQAAPTQNATMLVDRVEVRALDEASSAVVSGTDYRIENTCGDKVLGVAGSNVEQVTTQAWTGADTQKWTVSLYPSSTYWKIKNKSSGMTMNIAYSSGDNGAQVIQYADNGGSNAEFTIAPGINGIYEISAHNSGKFLDVPGGSTSAGVGLIQWGHSGTCAQKYRLIAQ